MRTPERRSQNRSKDEAAIDEARLVLSLSFGALAAMLVTVQFFGYIRGQAIEASVDRAAENALASIRLVARMGRDLDRSRHLVERQVAERAGGVADPEGEITVLRADYLSAAHDYARLASFPGEAAAWRRFEEDAALMNSGLDEVMAFSRKKLEDQARQGFAALGPSIEAYELEEDALVRINQAAASSALADVKAGQRSIVYLRGLLAFLAVVVTITIGFWTAKRLIGEMRARMRSTEQLQHADRLATVGQLAAGIAHELGSPLQVVSGRAKMVATGEAIDGEAREAGKIILAQAVRMTQIIRGLLDFSRRRPAQTSVADLREIAQDTLRILEPITKKKAVALELEVDGPTPVRADTVQIQQALTNLVMNAIQAVGERGHVGVVVRRQQALPPGSHAGGEADYACLAVKDDGPGIRQEDRLRIFEPFFTTKDVGEGTGLGLAVAHGLVTENRGWIGVESEVGRGSCFSIFLPIADEKAGAA